MSLRFIVNRFATKTAMSPSVQGISAFLNNPLTMISRSFASKKHKSLLKHAKGYRGRSKNCYRIAIRRVEKAWQYAYRDRRNQRREWRKLWILRLNAATRQYDMSYSRFIPALQSSGSLLNRKVLADLAANEPFAFKAVLDVVVQQQQQHQQQAFVQKYQDNEQM